MKRVFTAFLAFAMLLSMLPAQVYATQAESLTELIQSQIEDAEPEVTEPETTAPTEPEVTEPETTAPTELEVTEPETTAPTEPEVTEPETTAPAEPEPTQPEPTKPNRPANQEAKSGTCGETVTWNLSADGVLSLQGTGDMEAYTSASKVPWYSQRATVTAIVVGEGITGLSDYAFYGCNAATAATLPESLERIGHYAFQDCKALTEVVLPDAVTAIGRNAFYNCILLEKVTLPLSWTECTSTSTSSGGSNYQGAIFQNCKALTEIVVPDGMLILPDCAFSDANYLEKITLPDTLEAIGSNAFFGCKNLLEVKIPEKVSSIGNRAFRGCAKLAELVLPAAVTTIGAEAFYECEDLIQMAIPAGVTKLGDYTFYNCDALTAVTLPAGLLSIGREAFYSCGTLQSLVIPDSVQSLGYKAFANCTKLAELTLPASWNDCPSYSSNNTGSSYQGNLFYGCKALLEIEVPDGLTEIPAYAFYDAQYVQAIQLPDSLTKLRQYEFYRCKALKSITVPAGITAIPAYTFDTCSSLTQINLPSGLQSIGREAFASCSALQTLVIPDSVVSLGYRAFADCSKLSSLTLPASWNDCPGYNGNTGTSYQGNLFYGCQALLEVKVPDGLTEIPSYAFYNAKYVQTIQLPASMQNLGGSAFAGCNALRSIEIPEGVTELPTYAFSNCIKLESVTLPDSLVSVGREAFNNCDTLVSLTIPDSVQSLGYKAFAECDNLSSLTLPASWTECPSYNSNSTGYSYQGNLFYNCKSLLEIKIPEGLTKIPDYAFYTAKYVQTIQLPATLQELSASVFAGCNALQSIAIPEGITELPTYAFSNCHSLQSATLPGTLLSIGREAFNNCDSLVSLVIPDSVQSLGYKAFAECDSLSNLTLPASWVDCPSYNQYTGYNYQGNLFYNCKSLLEVKIPDNLTKIPAFAFFNAKYVQTIHLPASLQELDGSAFAGCNSLKNISLPESITSLPAYAFSNCNSLESITLPASLLSIGREAFNNCDSLVSLVIPDSVQSLGYRAFANCDHLTSITLPASWNDCPSYNQYTGNSYQGNLFAGCTALTEVTVPAGVTVLPAYAFNDCDSLQTVYLPEGMTDLGVYAFNDCNGLQTMLLPEGVTELKSHVFSNCYQLQQIQLPSTLQTVGEYAFYYCEKLEAVNFPDGLTTIDRYAFNSCKALKSVVLPDSVTKIGNYAFNGCSALEEIVIGENTEIGTGAFGSIVSSGQVSNISWSYNADNRTLTLKGSGDLVLERDAEDKVVIPWKHLRSLAKVLILEDGILSIDDEAFRGFVNITSLDTGNSLRRLGAYSFADCAKLKRVILGEGMKLVETGAFSGCTALTQLVIISDAGDLVLAEGSIPNSDNLTITYPETESEYEDKFKERFPNVGIETWDNTLPGRDVVLVLDVSGSMDGDRIESLKEAVKMFLDRVGGTATNSRVAIVTYHSEASRLSGFSWDMEHLKNMVDGLRANGGTTYINALDSAEEVLQDSDEEVRAMIFFTDGEPNDSQDPILAKCQELRKEYRIYTVGFRPSNSGQQLLQKMAGGYKNYYHSNDMESLAEAFKALSGGVGSEVEEEDYYALTVQRQFVIQSSKGGFPADIGFQIKVEDRTFRSELAEDALVSEETIVADIPEGFTGKVVISREGYVTYEMPAELIGNSNVVVMHPDTGTDPFPQQLLYQPAKNRQSYRNCFERVSIAEAALMDDASVTQRFYVDIQWRDHAPGEVWLSQGDKTVMLQDKAFADVAFSKTFLAGKGAVYLNFRSADGYTGSIKTAIYVSPADNRIQLEMGDGMSIPEEDMAKVKILGDRKFTIDFSEWGELPLQFEVESDGTITGTIGLKKDGKNLGSTVKGDGATLREAFSKLEKHKGLTDEKMADMIDDLTEMGQSKTGKFGLEGKVWLMGYFSGKLDGSGQLQFKEIKVYMIAEGSVSYTLPFTVMGIPLYFQTQLAAAIQAAVFLKQEDDSLVPTPGATVEVSMTVSVGGGIGCEGVLSGGVQGDGEAGMEIPILDPSDMNAYVKATFSLVGTLLGLKGKWELWKSDKYYFYKNGEFTWTKEMADAMNEDNFTLIPEPAHNSKFYATGLEQQTNDNPYLVLKSDTTQFSDPQLMTFANGTRLVVWADAVPGRTGADIYGVYYSYYNGSSWSSPKLVHDDGTNDYGLTLAEADGEAYVLWHDYDMSFSTDLTEVQQAAEHIDICVARFDRSSQSMVNVKQFSAGGYDHQPQMRKANGQLQLAWKCGVEEPEPMYLATSANGSSWSAPAQQNVSWYTENETSVPSDYNGVALNNLGEVDHVEEDGLRAIVFRRNDFSGTQNVFVVYNAGNGWGEPIQLTYFSGGTYVDTFSAEMHDGQLQLVMNVTNSGGKSDLAYMQVDLGTDLAVVRADYDHFTLVPGKSAVFFARVTNRGPRTEDMLKLRLVDENGNVLKTQLSEATIASGATERLEMNVDVPADNSLQNVTLIALPVHTNDVNEANNSDSFEISYTDISVEEIRAFSSDDLTMVNARIVNRGNKTLPESKYTLHYQTPEGQQVATGTIAQLEAGEVATLNLELDRLEVNELLYLKVQEHENENLSSNNMGMANILSVYGDVVTVQSVTIDREYVALEAGQSVQLSAVCEPEAGQEQLMWRVEDAEHENVITVTDNGLVTACGQGTAYAVAYVKNGDTEVAARCRIDVTVQPVAVEVKGVQLGTSGVTAELYSKQYATFEVVLQLDQNQTASVNDKPEAKGVAVTAARFANTAMAQHFDLVPADDRTLLIVPKDSAVFNPKTVKGSYTGKVIVTVDGKELTTPTDLKLTVKKTQPKLKASALTFNSFYPDRTQAIKITGATVKEIVKSSVPAWLSHNDGVLALKDITDTKTRNGTVNLEVMTEEWAIPLKVSCKVTAKYAAPSLKLSSTKVTFASDSRYSGGVELTLRCGNKKDTLTGLQVTGIKAPAGFVAEPLNLATGKFLLKAEGAVSAGQKKLQVTFADTTVTHDLPITVKAEPIKLKLQKTSVTLNAAVGDSARIGLTVTPSDYVLTGAEWRILDSKKQAANNALDISYADGALHVATNGSTAMDSSYTVYVKVPGSQEMKLTVKTMKQTAKAPSMSLKASGSVDLLYPDSEAKVTATFKNYVGEGPLTYSWSVDAYKGKTKQAEVTNAFTVRQEGRQYIISRNADAALQTGLTYKLNLTVQLPDGRTCTGTTSFSVKRTAVKLKLSPGSVTLNKKLGDVAQVKVTCTTKNYTLQKPDVRIMDSTGKNSAAGKLSWNWADGVLQVSTTAQSVACQSYRVLIRATEQDTPVTLKVSVRKDNASTVSVKLKVSGSLDVTQTNARVTVKPTYTNYIGGMEVTPQLQIFTTNDGKTYNVDVTSLFRITQEADGSLTVRKAANAELDHSRKYQVKLTATFENGVTAVSKLTSMSVKAGKVSVLAAPGTVTLYRNDRHSRGEFTLTPKKDTCYPVEKIAFKDAKLAQLYEIHSYGNGQFAIGFKGDQAGSKVKSQKITLNVFLEGNCTEKPNGTVTVKLTIR